MTRDEQIAKAIGIAQQAVGQLRADVSELRSHAEENDALGSSELYKEVRGLLHTAWRTLGDAYNVMADGDPEDYA